jgi:hypothetical protein
VSEPSGFLRATHEKHRIGGSNDIALKKLYGERLATVPSVDTVEMKPIGRGTTAEMRSL